MKTNMLTFTLKTIYTMALITPTLLTHTNSNTNVGQEARVGKRPRILFWVAISAFSLIAGSEIAVALWLPTYGHEMQGFSQARSNLLLSVFLMGMVAGRFASSAYSKKISSRAVIAICGVLLISIVPTMLFRNYSALATSLLFLGLGFSAVWPSYFDHISRIFPEHIGMMGGGAVFATQMGFAICSSISGRLADIRLSYPLIFGTIVMATFVTIFFLSPIGRARKGIELT